ncbi:hypothetical protein AB0L05_04585 [Nonomuraea pusilla]|uniref:hypothetical protein n=1 Tax=Nonomuraea pusilla TaxID=46177 RepID=UPI00332C3974
MRACLVASQLLGLALSRCILRFPPTVASGEELVPGWVPRSSGIARSEALRPLGLG